VSADFDFAYVGNRSACESAIAGSLQQTQSMLPLILQHKLVHYEFC